MTLRTDIHDRIAPNIGTATYLGIEDAIELRTGGEATLSGDDIIAEGGIILHHLLGSLKTDVAEPDTES